MSIIQQLEDLKEWSQDSTRYERRLNFRGGQLVQPGPGRQGYATSKTPSKKFKYKITNQSGTVWSDNPPGGWEGDYLKMEKDPKFKEWLKTEEIDYDKIEGKHKGNIRKRFQTFLKYKDNIGIKELAEHTPFTHNTMREMIYNADKKIEKQMPYKTKSKIKNAKRVVAEMEKAGIVALDVGKKEWRYKTLNQKKIKALNNIAYGPRTFNPDTMDEMYRLFENEKFMDWVKKYDGGKIPDEIIETVYKKGNRGAYAFMQLGRVLQGKAELEGVLKNKKLGDRIVSAMVYDASKGKRGPMWGASYNYVKHDMNKYAGKNMTWDGLGNAIKREFKEINKSLPKNSKINNIAIDEVFPIRTGSSSIGELKGADAYSNFVQFIDSEINSTKKVTFDGQSTQRAKKIIAELKKSNPDYELVKKLSQTQDAQIKKFYKENPGTRGKVNLQRFPWDEKTKRFLNPKEVFEAQYKGRYAELPSKIRTGMEKFHAKHKLSIDPGTARTMEEAGSDVTTLRKSKEWRNAVKSGKAKMLAKTLELAGIPICSSQSAKASGGRIGFAEQVCGVKFAEQNEDAFMKKAGQSGDAAKLFKSGQIGRFLKGAKSWTLANMGPAGWIGGEILIMGLGTLYEVSQGKGWKEGLDTWTGLGSHFGMAEKRLKEIGREQGWGEQEIYDAIKFGKLLELDQEAEEKEAELEDFLERQDIGGTARFKSSDIPSVTQNITGALYDEEPSYPDYSGTRNIGERGYIRGKYQDPKFLRDLKEEVPEIWKEGDALYKTLMNPQTSMALHQELQDRKKYEELKRKEKIWKTLQRRPGIGQQVEAPEPSDLGPFERSPGHPGYTGAFINWKPDFYAEGGIASLKKK